LNLIENLESKTSRPDTSAIKKQNPNPATEVPLKSWIGIMGAMLGAFMVVLDIQITNSSLQEIQAALGATLEEGSWISTAYLVAEVVVIPLTGWLSQVCSVRWYLLVHTALFIFFSMCCAWSVNLPMIIVFRALQGFTGGIMRTLTS
jgi:DHA2 family multidrug resistance protein